MAPKPARILFVLDDGVAPAHPGLPRASRRSTAVTMRGALELAAPVLVVPGGEQGKNDHGATEQILQAIHDASLDRHSYVAAIGGGAVLDVVGYAAAMAHRGIRLIRFPTTVLAQDDSAVGVKNGINAFGQKNYLGTFTPPFAVVNDFVFLTTLSDRDWRGGLSEAVKAALIKDAHVLRIHRGAGAPARGPRPDGDGAGRAPVGRAASPAHRDGRRSVRDGLVAAARLRALGGAQARAADRTISSGTARRWRSASRSTPPIRISRAFWRRGTGGA